MNLPYTSSKELNKIDSLKSKNSSGYNEITTDILKISKHLIISPIYIVICNKMLAQGIYPERLKFSLIRPIYKRGDKSGASKYRPISLKHVFSKKFDKVICNRLFDHLNKNTILNEYQYGFRSVISIETASHMLLNEIPTAVNCRQMVRGIFCDLHKAFGCINYVVPLKKLKYYGVSGTFYNLVKSYLNGRFVCVFFFFSCYHSPNFLDAPCI
jgi:hypothetical protein